jgi:hypothetical protein
MTGAERKKVRCKDFRVVQNSSRPCGKSGLSTIAAGEARISSNFCHLSSTLALELA